MHLDLYGMVKVQLLLQSPDRQQSKTKEGRMGIYVHNPPPIPAPSPPPAGALVTPLALLPRELLLIGYRSIRDMGIDWKLHAGLLYEISQQIVSVFSV
jgi:hypothetical protein